MSNAVSALRRKISVANDLRSVVRTMKSVAAANIGQYESSVKALIDYSRTVQLGLSVCLRGHNKTTIQKAKTPAIGAIVFGSDQGLIGQFNEIVADFAFKRLNENSHKTHPLPLKIWAVGGRVHLQLENLGLPTKEVFNLPESVTTITPLVQELTNDILAEMDSDRVSSESAELYLFYNHPSSGSTYEPTVLQLLPLDHKWRSNLIKLKWPTRNLPETIGEPVTLRAFIREYIFVSIFRACAESLASENASRLAAMQRADKNIEDLLVKLNGTFHRSRQTEIDEELFDVVAGFEILGDG